jgi:hypothetical protein
MLRQMHPLVLTAMDVKRQRAPSCKDLMTSLLMIHLLRSVYEHIKEAQGRVIDTKRSRIGKGATMPLSKSGLNCWTVPIRTCCKCSRIMIMSSVSTFHLMIAAVNERSITEQKVAEGLKLADAPFRIQSRNHL